SARQGMSVALSADGNTAIVGGPGDNPWDRSRPFRLGAPGAAWVFTRSGGVWTQQGNKLVSNSAVGRLGTSVALSADGNIAVVGKAAPSASVDSSIIMVGQPNDNRGARAATVFTRRGGGSDSQEVARPSATSNAAVNFEE